MPKELRTFTKEFKREAVHLVQTSGKSQVQVARDLGIADSTLHHWCKEFSKAGEKAFVGSGNPATGEKARIWEGRFSPAPPAGPSCFVIRQASSISPKLCKSPLRYIV